MRVWWRRMVAMTWKELLQLSRDPILLSILVYFFTADIYLAGSGISMDLRHAGLAVLDHDRSAASRDLIHRFQPPWFELKGEVASGTEGIALLDAGEVLGVLDIPAHFARDLRLDLGTAVQLQLDTTNVVPGTLGAAYAERIVARFAQDRAFERLGLGPDDLERLPLIQDRHRVWYNPNQVDPWFMSISELLTVVTMLSLMLPAAAAVREKERGTIEQLLVSPLSPAQVLLPKVVAMTLAILAGAAAALYLIMRPVFAVPIAGSAGLFFAVTALYVFTTSGLGLFIATLSRNLGQVTMLVILILMPVLLLSGTWTPPEAMPSWLRPFMWVSPLAYYVDLAYGILLKGAGLAILWPRVSGLGVLGGLLFAFGVWRFRRQLG